MHTHPVRKVVDQGGLTVWIKHAAPDPIEVGGQRKLPDDITDANQGSSNGCGNQSKDSVPEDEPQCNVNMTVKGFGDDASVFVHFILADQVNFYVLKLFNG